MSLFSSIPRDLRKAHEDGEVIFFCGAGISKAAGLPTFWELVKTVVEKLVGDERHHTNDPAWKALKDYKLDEALDILERDSTHGHGSRVREEVVSLLSKRPRSLDAHVTLCRLASLDEKDGRLVTTNLENLFEKGARKLRKTSAAKHIKHIDIGPGLPPPKTHNWHSLVYLHGRIGNPADNGENKTLVLTTADFGAAYLVDRWASKFVTELFRNFTVVFVGYSVDDQTMNYLVRALAAERDSNPSGYKKPYAFACFSLEDENLPSNADEVVSIWDRKGVSAIPYDAADNHKTLWDGLHTWADLHRGGGEARRRVAVELGRFEPVGIGAEEKDLMAWALNDQNGETARLFAEQDEAGSAEVEKLHIKWLPIIDELGLLALPDINLGHKVPLVGYSLFDQFQMHPVTTQIGRWLCLNLHEPLVLEWAMSQGGVLHQNFRWMVHDALRSEGLADRPVIPPGLAKVWRQLADRGYAYQLARKSRDFGHGRVMAMSPVNHQAMQLFLDRLEPVPVFKHRLKFGDDVKATEYPDQATSFCEVGIHLIGVEHAQDVDNWREAAEDWDGSLAVLANELTTLLARAMSSLEAFDMAGSMYDHTYIDYRSVSPHSQNEHTKTWTLLIDLTRDAYSALAERDANAAERLALRWAGYHYPIFKRLVLHAATGGRDA